MLQRFEQINKEILLVIFVENAWHVENLIDQYPVLPNRTPLFECFEERLRPSSTRPLFIKAIPY